MNIDRYHRQIILQNIGVIGQEKLLNAKVLVIGAGGLGCPALQYLAAAGVGYIGIVDFDIVHISNLHRQILYGEADIDQSKVTCAKKSLMRMDPSIVVNTYDEKLTTSNIIKILEQYEIILDCTDNFSTRYLINDACVLLQKKLVFGAISQWQGQVAIFNASSHGISYRDLFPFPPQAGEIKNCSEAGVIGVLPGLIGTLMASETIKIICGIGESLIDKIYTLDALTLHAYTYSIMPNAAAKDQMPRSIDALIATDYDAECGISSLVSEIDVEVCIDKVKYHNALLIDIRENHEQPKIKDLPCVQIPWADLKNNVEKMNAAEIILCCHTGKRSLLAANEVARLLHHKKRIYSLEGGIISYITYLQNTHHHE